MCAKCGAFHWDRGVLVPGSSHGTSEDTGLEGSALSALAGSFVGASLPQVAYQSGSLDEATLAAQFGAFPSIVDAFVSATGDPSTLTGLVTKGNTAVVTQAIDDPANPGQQTIRNLGGAQAIPWGQMAKFPGLPLTPQAQGGHGLQVWWMYDQPGTLQVKAPPGTTVPANSPAGQAPTAPGATGSGLPPAPPPSPSASNYLLIAGLVLVVAVGAFVLWEIAASFSAARRLAGSK